LAGNEAGRAKTTWRPDAQWASRYYTAEKIADGQPVTSQPLANFESVYTFIKQRESKAKAEEEPREQARREEVRHPNRKATGVGVLAGGLAVIAFVMFLLWRKAIVLQLAAEGSAMVSNARPGNSFRGVLQILAAHRSLPGINTYLAMQSAARQLMQVDLLI